MVEQQMEIRMIRGQFDGWKGVRLYHRWWEPEDDPRGVLIVVHGMSEHSGWYEDLAYYLAPYGFRVESFDLRGHGRSGGLRCYVESFDEYIKDLAIFHEQVEQRSGGLPTALFGHSMGGVISTLYAMETELSLRGLLLSAPALDITVAVPMILRPVATVLGKLLPKLPTTSLSSSDVFHNEQIASEYRKDPLVWHKGVRARTGTELIRAGKQALAQAEMLTLPLMVMQGTDDKLTAYEASRQLYHDAASEDKTLYSYEGWYHHLIHEPQNMRIYGNIRQWLEERLS